LYKLVPLKKKLQKGKISVHFFLNITQLTGKMCITNFFYLCFMFKI